MTDLNSLVFQSIVEKSIDAVVIINRDGNIIYWNDAAEDIFGYTKDEIIGKHMHDILPSKDLRKKANQKFAEFQKTGHGDLIGNFVVATALSKSGDIIDVQFGVNTVEYNGEQFIFAFIRNISDFIDMRKKHAKLESQATTDELTGILNRRAFTERSEAAFSMACRHQEPFSFLMLDIDFFKSINDQYGHHVGDTALQSFVNAISKMTRAEDIFGRIGGEEFCIAMIKTPKEVALGIAERIRKKIASKKIICADITFTMTVSIGLSSNEGKQTELSDIRVLADKALYQAKHSGRNKVIVT